MPATAETVPETPRRTLEAEDARIEMADALASMVHILDGALHFSPSHLVSSKVGGGEKLTPAGLDFARGIYRLSAEAARVVDVAWSDLPECPIQEAAREARPHVVRAALVARAIGDPDTTEPDLPEGVSAYHALELIHEDMEAARAIIAKLPRPRRCPPRAHVLEGDARTSQEADHV